MRLFLLSGGSAIDAVSAAVTVMEDSPVFNAGRGSVLNNQGFVEMDASIMNGATSGLFIILLYVILSCQRSLWLC